MVQTTIKVRNSSPAPIARSWSPKPGTTPPARIVAGGRGVINGLLQPGEIQTITIDTPYSAKMKSNNWNFTHANGTVKPAKVKTLERRLPTRPPRNKLDFVSRVIQGRTAAGVPAFSLPP